MEPKDLAAWIGSLAAAVSAVVAIFLLRQLLLTSRQLELAREEMKLNARWNQLSAAFTYFGNKELAERELEAVETLQALKINLYDQKSTLGDDIVEAVLIDQTHFRKVKGFLNFLEDYSAAVNAGVMDSEVSYALMADLITRYYKIFRTLLEKRRTRIDNPRLWIELEQLALQWEPRRIDEERKLVEEIQQAHQRNEEEIEKVKEKERQQKAAILSKTRALDRKYKVPS